MSEDAAALGRSFLLNSYCLPQLVRLFFTCCHWSSFVNVDVSHPVLFVLVFSDVTARCVRLSNRHLLIISVFRSTKHTPSTSINSSSFPLFHSLCLGDSVFVRINPCFSCQRSLNDRSDSLWAFIIMWLCRFSMRCTRCTSWTASRVSVSFNVRRQDVESSWFNLWHSFNQILGNGGPAPSLSAVTFFVNYNSGATICHGVPHKPSQFVDSQASLNVCLVQLLPRTTPCLVMHKTAPVRS